MACRTDNPLRLCRMYACIADVLGMMAAGGIRGGPAANISFKKAFALLEVCAMIFHDTCNTVCIVRMFYTSISVGSMYVNIMGFLLMEYSIITNGAAH